MFPEGKKVNIITQRRLRLSEYSIYTTKCYQTFFDVLLTVHLSIILVINQLDAQNRVL